MCILNTGKHLTFEVLQWPTLVEMWSTQKGHQHDPHLKVCAPQVRTSFRYRQKTVAPRNSGTLLMRWARLSDTSYRVTPERRRPSCSPFTQPKCVCAAVAVTSGFCDSGYNVTCYLYLLLFRPCFIGFSFYPPKVTVVFFQVPECTRFRPLPYVNPRKTDASFPSYIVPLIGADQQHGRLLIPKEYPNTHTHRCC